MLPARSVLAPWPALLAVLCVGCVMPPRAPRAVLDAKTGVSLTVVDEPLVLARERRDVAVQARDYLTLVAAEIDESGRRQLVWIAYQWSTIDTRNADARITAGSKLLVVADGRDLHLQPTAHAFANFDVREPALLRPDDADVITTIYEMDAATLEYVATCRQLAASYPDSFALPFALWRDGRPAIARLLAEISPN